MKRAVFAAAALFAAAAPASAQNLHGLDVQGLDPMEGEPQQLVVLIHGYTQTGQSMRPLAEALSARLIHAAIVYPDAPLEAQSGRSWYNFRGDDAEATRIAAREGVQELVAELADAFTIDPSNIAIVGFSQGGGVALGAATCAAPDYAAAVSIAGVINEVCDADAEGAKTSFLFVHSIDDPTVPLARGEAAVAMVNDAGYAAEMEAFEGDTHWPSADAIARVQDFVVEALTE
ncbi:MAG: alpha/beta fold hydrolase [Maricaulaceae bacterium]|jgi:phospholipase/carboxylesterase